ncbi:MAG: glycosyltransferase family 4 protein [Nanobdellota archaeon]
MSKLKIAFILLAYDLSGGERAVHEIIKSLLNTKDVEITLITNNEVIPHYSKIRELNIKSLGSIYISNRFWLRLILPKLVKKLRDILAKDRFDIISLHMESPIEMVGRLDKDIFLPIVSTLHGSELVILSNSLLNNLSLIKKKGFVYFVKMIYYKIFIKSYLLKILDNSKITVVGNHQINNLPKIYKKKAIVISNGVDSNLFKPLNKIKQKKNVILFTGRFIDIKGIQEIVNVAKQLPKYEFWFAGQGPLANLINLSNTKNLGFKKTEELVKLYNEATICIFPSHREGFPLCGLEAMSCGRALIATPLGFSEYIKNGREGIIIPAKDEIALKNAIVDLMTNEKKRKMIEKNARNKALKYSWDKIAQKYLKLFKEVIDKNANIYN